ncbi:hypothetical protein BD324DRAFT_647577 [Kockovaella imperatae]|uniref:BZIP domain-containing protein n=1 Tax=Kockovaella imperatae TaxID=4999 RepID=A0A1Y1URG9_9TREE|nr:hypothetical protein BD324DRAFT_647577 [Kockovaella imperatae]ORX40658.1 hypothetical protein BD324DRAFT_647577 [Kockovaella imperatae]
MARGRAIDLKLPPTRARTQQRDYRARKAAHTRDLEEENARLRHVNAVLQDEASQLRSMYANFVSALEESQRDLMNAQRRLDAARDALTQLGTRYPPYTNYSSADTLVHTSHTNVTPSSHVTSPNSPWSSVRMAPTIDHPVDTPNPRSECQPGKLESPPDPSEECCFGLVVCPD